MTWVRGYIVGNTGACVMIGLTKDVNVAGFLIAGFIVWGAAEFGWWLGGR